MKEVMYFINLIAPTDKTASTNLTKLACLRDLRIFANIVQIQKVLTALTIVMY